MNTLHFRYAVEVERTRSITQAAEHLFMAQPNLSKAIKELEDTLKITIFERTSKGVVPTPKGVEFLTYAKNILAQLDKMESLYVPENSKKQYFNISIPRGSYITTAFARFVADLDEREEIDVNVQETNSMQIINNIDSGASSLGIIRYQKVYENYFMDYLSEKGLCYDPIWEFEYVALMSKNHPYAEVEKIKHTDLKKFTEIIHGDNTIPYLLTQKNKKAKETSKVKKIYIYERCSQFELLTTVPSTYMWVSPIPEDLMNRYELVQRKCDLPNSQCKDLLVYPKGYKFTKLDKRFIDKLYTAKNEVALKEYH
ncbi:MAG: LysR family transcriptional regulator [Oscillospiraceae bacterium]